MKKLIITADDYGMSRAVNEGIEAGVAAGVIKSTNVMPGMAYCDGISKLKKKFPHLSVGLHWHLTAGFPVCQKNTISSLIDDQGKLWSYSEFIKRFRKKLISLDEIRIELIAQYQRFCDFYGDFPDYWNTHHNLLVGFRLFNLFLEVASSLNIKKMRNRQRLYVPAKGKTGKSIAWLLTEPAKRAILKKWIAKAKRIGFSSPDGIIVPLNEEDKLDLEYVFKHINWKQGTVGEMVIHPATSIDSEYFGAITEKRIKEFLLFSDQAVIKIAEKNGIELCGFEGVK